MSSSTIIINPKTSDTLVEKGKSRLFEVKTNLLNNNNSEERLSLANTGVIILDMSANWQGWDFGLNNKLIYERKNVSSSNTGNSWSGELRGGFGDATVLLQSGRIFGSFTSDSEIYSISTRPDGSIWVEARNVNSYPED